MSFRIKFLLSFLAVSLIPLAIAGLLTFTESKEVVVSRVINQLESLAILQERRVNETIDRYLEQAKLITSRTQLRTSLKNYNETGGQEEYERINNIINDGKNSTPIIDDINVINTEGFVITSTNEQFIGENIANEDYFSEGKKTHLFYNLFKNQDNILKVRLVGPFVLENEVIGVVEIISSADPIISITEDYTGLGETGEMIIARKNDAGDALFLTPLRFDSGAALIRAVAKDKINVPMIDAVSGNEKIFTGEETVDYRGETVFAVSRFIESLNWGLVAKIDQSEALNSVSSLLRFYILTIFLVFIVSILFSLMISRSISKPVFELTSAVKKFEEGLFNQRIKVKSNDEIGLLSSAFNKMASQLQDLYKKLEKKVKERTSELQKAKKNLEKNLNELNRSKNAMLNILEDIEEEKEKTKNQLLETLKFELAVQSATDGVMITDTKHRIVYVNPAWEKITGYSKKEALGKDSHFIKSKQSSEDLYKEVLKQIESGNPFITEEMVHKRKDGTEYIAHFSIFPVGTKDGEAEYYVALEQDITHRKEVDRTKTEFVSLASHQLKSPLTSIKWYIEMLLNGDMGKLTPVQKETLEEVAKSSENLSQLVGSMLNVSRLDLGTFWIKPEKVDLIKICEETCNELKLHFKKKNQTLSKNFFSKSLVLKADPNILRIIFQNLLSNANKYTLEKGKISIDISKTKREIIIKVKDSGIGIPRKDQEKMFSKLFRASNSNSTNATGNGLGLYTIKSTLEAAGGKIWFESKEGKGSIFYVSLPVSGMRPREGKKALQ